MIFVFFNVIYGDTIQHYGDVIMGVLVSQITSLTIVYSNVYSGADQRKHQSSASLVFVRVIHRWIPFTGEFPHKWPVTRKMFPFDNVIMSSIYIDEIAVPNPVGCTWGIRSKCILNLKLVTTRFLVSHPSVVQSFRNSAQSAAMILSCSFKIMK